MHVPTIASVEDFQYQGLAPPDIRVEDLVSVRRAEENELLGFVRDASQMALQTSRQIHATISKYRNSAEYPSTPLAMKLRTVAQFITAGLNTEVYYLTIDGFDTHSEQADSHAGLLRALGDGISAFISDLNNHRLDDQVLVVCFSEFGRRVKENASHGTDHGTAAPMLLAGRGLRGGLFGEHPSLQDLDDGDVRFHTDFRQVYRSVLERWLRVDSAAILGAEFELLELWG